MRVEYERLRLAAGYVGDAAAWDTIVALMRQDIRERVPNGAALLENAQHGRQPWEVVPGASTFAPIYVGQEVQELVFNESHVDGIAQLSGAIANLMHHPVAPLAQG